MESRRKTKRERELERELKRAHKSLANLSSSHNTLQQYTEELKAENKQLKTQIQKLKEVCVKPL